VELLLGTRRFYSVNRAFARRFTLLLGTPRFRSENQAFAPPSALLPEWQGLALERLAKLLYLRLL
jgi:hypothetical protein